MMICAELCTERFSEYNLGNSPETFDRIQLQTEMYILAYAPHNKLGPKGIYNYNL
jgi:hypothetical protein